LTNRLLVGLGLACALFAAAAPAAGQLITDQRVWTALSLQGRAAEASPWRWSIDSQLRTRDGVRAVDVFTLRFGIGRDLTDRSNLGAGYGNTTTFPIVGELITEHRAFQQYLWIGRTDEATIALRTRFEERFIEGNSGVAYRVRQQVRYSRPFAARPRFTLVLWDEFHVHLNGTSRFGRGVDQNRAFGGLGRAFTTRVRLEAGYLNQYSNSRLGSDRMNHILYVGVNETF
jgi:hypothetical protein